MNEKKIQVQDKAHEWWALMSLVEAALLFAFDK